MNYNIQVFLTALHAICGLNYNLYITTTFSSHIVFALVEFDFLVYILILKLVLFYSWPGSLCTGWFTQFISQNLQFETEYPWKLTRHFEIQISLIYNESLSVLCCSSPASSSPTSGLHLVVEEGKYWLKENQKELHLIFYINCSLYRNSLLLNIWKSRSIIANTNTQSIGLVKLDHSESVQQVYFFILNLCDEIMNFFNSGIILIPRFQ